MDADGIHVAWVGTAVWALAAVWVRLADAPQWWWWTCLSGVVLGVVGLGYCLWRRQRRGRAEAADLTPDDPSAALHSAGSRPGSVEQH